MSIRPKYTRLLQNILKEHIEGVREWQIWIFQQRLSFLTEKVRKRRVWISSPECLWLMLLNAVRGWFIKTLRSVCIFIDYFVLMYSNFNGVLISQLHHVFASSPCSSGSIMELKSCWQALKSFSLSNSHQTFLTFTVNITNSLNLIFLQFKVEIVIFLCKWHRSSASDHNTTSFCHERQSVIVACSMLRARQVCL